MTSATRTRNLVQSTRTLHGWAILPVWMATSFFHIGRETGPMPSASVGMCRSSPRYPMRSTGLMTAAVPAKQKNQKAIMNDGEARKEKGETQSVPVPKNSTSRPSCAAAFTSFIVTGRSLTTNLPSGMPSIGTFPDSCSRARARTESRVTPGRIMPPNGGVTSSVASSVYPVLSREHGQHSATENSAYLRPDA